MNSIFKKPEISSNKGRNGFDVGRRRIMTQPCGMLLPVYDDFANPGDKYKLNTEAFIRTDAVETAAFLRLKYHVDWFFVPITQLYAFWNEFYNGTQDVMTSFAAASTNAPNNDFAFPWFDIYTPMRFEGNNFFAPEVPATGSGEFELQCDEFGVPKAWNMRRLFDLFGYGTPDTSTALRGTEGVFCTLGLKYLAYHKIFHSHYLVTDFFKNDPTYFNVDVYHGKNYTSLAGSPVNKLVSKIHYRPYRKDFFTNIQPSPVFNSAFANYAGSAGFSFLNSTAINPDGTTGDARIGVSGSSGFSSNADGSLTNLEDPYGISFNSASLRLGDIRAMYAYDKLLRVTASTGSHYDQQTLAHFGVELPKGIGNEAYFLGSQVTDIIINEVVATASTGAMEDGQALAGSTIGDIAGKAFGATSGQGDVNFTAPCHGIIMAISSIEPIVDYASRGVEVDNRKTKAFDFYHPEFDNLGMQPLLNGDFLYNQVGMSTNSDTITGWQYRYSECKCKFDVVNESIWATFRNSWAGNKQSLFAYQPVPSSPGNVEMTSLNSYFYIAPQYTNNIFVRSFPFLGTDDPTYPFVQNARYTVTNDTHQWQNDFNKADNVYAGDNFLVNLDIKAFKTSIMSVHSMPKL